MTPKILGLLLFAVACEPAQTPSDAPALPIGQAPPPTFDLTAHTAAVAGQTLVLLADGVPAGAQIFVIASTASAGPPACPPAIAPACVDLPGPVRVLLTMIADAQGHAEAELPVPTNLIGRTLRLQGVVRSPAVATSPVVSREVLDLPCRKAYDLRDDFSASTLGVDWAVVDQSTGGVANWALGSGFAVETGNADRPPEFGTWLQPTVVSYGISRFRARLYAYDDDQIGLMYGIRSPADHQRIDLDVDGYRAQLLSTRADVSTTLAVQNAYTVPHRSWYSLQVDYDGVRQVVRVNDQVLFDVEAPECLVGGIGLFARQMSDARFDDVVLDGPARRCGDGALDPGEQCDDGNLLIGDGCDQLCAFSEEGARDHDGDGVTDFHEANVAGTDPYTP